MMKPETSIPIGIDRHGLLICTGDAYIMRNQPVGHGLQIAVALIYRVSYMEKIIPKNDNVQ